MKNLNSPDIEENVLLIPTNVADSSLDYQLERKRENIKQGAKKITVFIVDDDPIYLKALEHFISHKLPQVNIKTFQTGEACLEQMKLKPNIIILDYYLNSRVADAQNGLVILEQIKKQNPSSKVIMLSSQNSLNIALRCIRTRCFDYIAKNKFAFKNLNKVLANIIGNFKIDVPEPKTYPIIFFKEHKLFLN